MKLILDSPFPNRSLVDGRIQKFLKEVEAGRFGTDRKGRIFTSVPEFFAEPLKDGTRAFFNGKVHLGVLREHGVDIGIKT